ncbi:conserved phage C-terminal domain-containing protein [Paenibacillus campinasensis]|uniref:Phage conserved hypothetical protein C-terminal domain-containing protein n=1 Tax=Paenibacillus campinasensis TaxID=66347 RepID=A0A268ELF2_9BACL|nr:conserved phage C-terminal domain-containing protein [Paenibacillus campinasensis]PAD73945.1 hypothetical protein CHH67_19110 [Paenibacillus campinasensis]
MSGFIPIGRELQNHWLRRDKDYWMVFCEMAFLARFSDSPEVRVIDGQEVTIRKREFIFGRSSWSTRMDISERRLRTLVKKLVDEGFIKQIAKYSKFTIYSFEYIPGLTQKSDQHNDQQSDQQKPGERPAETFMSQGISGDSDQHKFEKRPAQRPAERPQKEEGIKEESNKEEGINNMAKNHEPIAKEVIAYLNQKMGKRYRATPGTMKNILGRLNEGYSKEDCIHVIDVKCAEWIGTDKEKYLDYETLFRPSKFPKYLNQRLEVVTRKGSDGSYSTKSQRAKSILDQELRKEGGRDGTQRRDITHEVDYQRLPEFRG